MPVPVSAMCRDTDVALARALRKQLLDLEGLHHLRHGRDRPMALLLHVEMKEADDLVLFAGARKVRSGA